MFFRKKKMRRAIEEHDRRSTKKRSAVANVVRTVDEGEVSAIMSALAAFHSGYGTQNPSIEPMLVLRDPSCAAVLFEAILRLPERSMLWPSFCSLLTTLLDSGEMDATSACAFVGEHAPELESAAAHGASIALLRQGRAAEALDLTRRHDGCDSSRLLIEVLAEPSTPERKKRLEHFRTNFARDGARDGVGLLLAEASCSLTREHANKLLRYVVTRHGGTPYNVPALVGIPRPGEGPCGLYLVVASRDTPERSPAVMMLVVSESEEEAERWGCVFEAAATNVESERLMSVESRVSGLCLPWGSPRFQPGDPQVVVEDWTGLTQLRRLCETTLTMEQILAIARAGNSPHARPTPTPSFIPPLYSAIMRAAEIELQDV